MSKKPVDIKKRAVALKYRWDYAAPKVVASGKGQLADKIIQSAQDANVKLHKDAKLAAALSMVDVGAEIPPELYQVVAQILVFVDNLDALEAMRDYEKH